MAVGMPTGNGKSRAAGFTYIGLLLMMAIAGIALAAAGLSWQNTLRAEREQELLFIGRQYRDALNSYFQSSPAGMSSPAGINSYPATLEDLLQDKRYPGIKRHLRRLYADPMTGRLDWGLVRQQGRIVGLYSQSESVPLKHKGFTGDDMPFTNAVSYRRWVFGQDIAPTTPTGAQQVPLN